MIQISNPFFISLLISGSEEPSSDFDITLLQITFLFDTNHFSLIFTFGILFEFFKLTMFMHIISVTKSLNIHAVD